jgi:hypothetical protein
MPVTNADMHENTAMSMKKSMARLPVGSLLPHLALRHSHIVAEGWRCMSRFDTLRVPKGTIPAIASNGTSADFPQ